MVMTETNKRRLLIVLIVLSIIPTFFLLPFHFHDSLKSNAVWAADALGYIGVVLMIWMYVLGAKSVFGMMFRDLAPVLKIHKWLGKYGTLAIFAHPILIILGFGESILYMLIPDASTLYESHVTLGRIALWLVVMIWLSSWWLREKIAFRPWKYLHYLSYIAVPFALLHVPDVGTYFMSSLAVKIYFFILVVFFLIFIFLRVRGLLNLDKFPYRVVNHVQLNSTDYILNLEPISEYYAVPNRGQYVYLKLGYISEDHPFSVLQYNRESHNLAIGYRVFGTYTDIMSSLKKDTLVQVSGPCGSFMAHISDSPRPIVYLAGGIGITPFIDEIFNLYGQREQWLFAANRSRETAVLVPQVAPALGNRLISVYNTAPLDMKPGEEVGFITESLLKKYLGENLARYDFYLCGPPPMMEAMHKLMKNAGVPDAQVQSEKFGW